MRVTAYALSYALLGITAAAAVTLHEGEARSLLRSRRLEDGECKIVARSDGLFFCESSSGELTEIEGTDVQKQELASKLNDGLIVSSETFLDMPGAGRGADASGMPIVALPANQKVHVKNPSSHGNNGRGPFSTAGRRRLATVTGAKPVLVLRVTDGDGKVWTDAAETISQNVYGPESVDPVNLVSQYAACSYGKLNITNDYVSTGVMTQQGFDTVSWSATGVLDVTTQAKLSTSVKSVEDEAILRAEEALGMTLPGGFQHVLISVAEGFGAYAYINGYRSVFTSRYIGEVSYLVHEIGHNLNLAHSGEITDSDDQTCLMGNTLGGDDAGRMCFNAAKNWQLTHGSGSEGWYTGRTLEVDLRTASPNRLWLVGLSEMDVGGNTYPIAVKLESGSSMDFFLSFNRATGINSDNVEADDQVTLYKAGGNGLGYSVSYLQAKLSQGESKTINDFLFGRDLNLSVLSIDLGSTPAIAEVEVSLGPPVNCGAGIVDVEVTIATDNYSSETTWSVKEVSDSGHLGPSLMEGGPYTTAGQTYTASSSLSVSGCLFFEILDSGGDGICCNYGSGSYSLKMEGSEVKSGGDFRSEESTLFGLDPPPTSGPTTHPTNSPTSSVAPTAPPTKPPTGAPTSPPSPAPTNSPLPPTNPPTDAPTSPPTNPPTNNPTNHPTAFPTASPIPCNLADIDESCRNDEDCCSGSCSGGSPKNRVCLATTPTTPPPTTGTVPTTLPPTQPATPPPTLPTTPPPTPPVGTCEPAGASCRDSSVNCCNGCSGGKPSTRVCL